MKGKFQNPIPGLGLIQPETLEAEDSLGKAAVAIIGIIPTVFQSEDDFVEDDCLKLISDFELLESYPSMSTPGEECAISMVRRRMKYIRESFPNQVVLEVNLNAFSSIYMNAIKRPENKEYFPLKQQRTIRILKAMRPRTLVVHGREGFQVLRNYNLLQVLSKLHYYREILRYFNEADFLDSSAELYLLPDLASRIPGVTDQHFQNITDLENDG
jgi:hypothetical protein